MDERTPPISARDLDGQSVAVILAGEDSTHVKYGTARATADGVIVEMDGGGSLPLPDHVMSRFQRVTDEDRADPDLTGILEGAAFLVAMSVGNVTDEEADAAGMISTGVRLPADDGIA